MPELLIEQSAFMEWKSSPGLILWCKMQVHWLHFLKGVVTLSCESITSVQGNSKVMLAHEPSFNVMDSEILSIAPVIISNVCTNYKVIS